MTEPRVTCPSCGYARGYHSDDCDRPQLTLGDFPNQCDDCGAVYTGLTYYSFDPSDCVSTRTTQVMGERTLPTEAEDEWIAHGEDCTGNICPACAGPHLNPDHEGDPRRPVVQGA